MTQLLSIVLPIVLSALAPLSHFTRGANRESLVLRESAPQAAERVYTSEEVDKAVVVKNINGVLSEFESRMRCKGEGITTISVVLRKTRKVTDVKVETTTGCKVPAKAIAALRKMKFTPALKNGMPVSQLYELDIKQELRVMPNFPNTPTP